MTSSLKFENVVSALFGTYIFTHGILNMLRGNDFEFGIALIIASLIFFSPIDALTRKWSGINIHYIFKIILALILAWVTLAVGAVNEGYYPEITG
ncbi:hypothetical protein [Fulvivirga lutimaris]|uniref:hypothetical protein n=1 Tax=Fulvivirga lutimaris TaxID=1819566 RepID=UPI0012BB8638|nr:hypothetical protein [Fulvivirga lutimaris]MTI41833.1 hypothetical protein [Fulvivirga lutimaris]